MPTTTPAPGIHTDLTVVAAATAAATAAGNDNNLNAEFHLECENLIVDLDSIQQDEGNAPLPLESLDDDVWNLERYRFNDDNNNLWWYW